MYFAAGEIYARLAYGAFYFAIPKTTFYKAMR
jgi:hypothetical protein